MSGLRLFAACVALIAQAGSAAVVLLDAQKGANAASHVESAGTNQHFAHDDADCFVCRAQHLSDVAPPNPGASLEVIPDTPPLHPSVVAANATALSSLRSRAPPVT